MLRFLPILPALFAAFSSAILCHSAAFAALPAFVSSLIFFLPFCQSLIFSAPWPQLLLFSDALFPPEEFEILH